MDPECLFEHNFYLGCAHQEFTHSNACQPLGSVCGMTLFEITETPGLCPRCVANNGQILPPTCSAQRRVFKDCGHDFTIIHNPNCVPEGSLCNNTPSHELLITGICRNCFELEVDHAEVNNRLQLALSAVRHDAHQGNENAALRRADDAMVRALRDGRILQWQAEYRARREAARQEHQNRARREYEEAYRNLQRGAGVRPGNMQQFLQHQPRPVERAWRNQGPLAGHYYVVQEEASFFHEERQHVYDRQDGGHDPRRDPPRDYRG